MFRKSVSTLAQRSSYKAVPKPAYNFWNMTYQVLFARGFMRVPIIIAIPMVYKAGMEPLFESTFVEWNGEWSQPAMWNAVEARTNERLQAKAEAEE
jgi:hypothetical protein